MSRCKSTFALSDGTELMCNQDDHDGHTTHYAGKYTWELDLSSAETLEAEKSLDALEAGEVRVTSVTGGSKGQKEARYDLIPGEALEKVARMYGRGAKKYDESNWRRGYDWSLSFAALNRHLWQFWNGEDMDEEMGMEHLTAVVFHALALLTFMDEHPEFDNRPSTLRGQLD